MIKSSWIDLIIKEVEVYQEKIVVTPVYPPIK
jgi:hypothetical protein